MQIEAVRAMDVSWLWMESATTPMHASVLCLFSPPPDAGRDFVRHLIEQFRSDTVASRPFERRRRRSGLGRIWPQWQIVDHIDLAYHLRCWELPTPGDRAELDALVSRLHGIPLDHDYPPWTVDIIEGLKDGRFALYGKVHHALADGSAAVEIISTWLSEDADERGMPPTWAYLRPRPGRARVQPDPADCNTMSRRPSARRILAPKLEIDLSKPIRIVGATLGAMRYAVRGVSARPWSAPRTALNAPITAKRRIVTQNHELMRFQTLARRAGGTVNDVVLASCAGALRRYLSEMGQLPERALTSMIPVSVRMRDRRQNAPNALTVGMLSLATDTADARTRFEAIRASTTELKLVLGGMDDRAIDVYTMLSTMPIAAGQITPAGAHVPAPFNILISNVPGPRKRMYFNGARMDTFQGLPLLFDRQSLAIVAVSYADQIEFSFTACEAAHPHIGRLPRYCVDALAELESAFPEKDASAR